jgi:hypothetical protein
MQHAVHEEGASHQAPTGLEIRRGGVVRKTAAGIFVAKKRLEDFAHRSAIAKRLQFRLNEPGPLPIGLMLRTRRPLVALSRLAATENPGHQFRRNRLTAIL